MLFLGLKGESSDSRWDCKRSDFTSILPRKWCTRGRKKSQRTLSSPLVGLLRPRRIALKQSSVLVLKDNATNAALVAVISVPIDYSRRLAKLVLIKTQLCVADIAAGSKITWCAEDAPWFLQRWACLRRCVGVVDLPAARSLAVVIDHRRYVLSVFFFFFRRFIIYCSVVWHLPSEERARELRINLISYSKELE